MNRIKIIAVFFALTTAISCEESTNRSNNETQTANTVKKDTIAAKPLQGIPPGSTQEFSFGQLTRYIPGDKLYGFEASEAVNGEDGSIGKSGSRYFPFARQKYLKKEQCITIEIIDYLMDSVQYNGLIRMFGFYTPIDNNVITTKNIDLHIPGTKAITTEYKIDTAAKIIIGAADRFMVIITGAQFRDLKLLEKVAAKIDLKKLVAEAKIHA